MELVEWQIKDGNNGLVMPWFTHPSLEYIKEMDLSGKRILEYGAGLGDAWLGKRCKELVVVERNKEWLDKAEENVKINLINNVRYIYRPCNDSSGAAEFYLEIPMDFKPDVIISDDAYRTEAVEMAINFFSDKQQGVLICDNYWQDFVWKSPKAIELLEPFEKKIFPQPGHINHEGNCWKTAIIFFNNETTK